MLFFLVKTYFHHFSLHRRVGILWSTPVGSPHVVRWEPSPVVGPALLGLAFGSTFRSLVLFPTLTILVILLVIAWRTPATWIASIMVTVCCIFTALHWNSTRACNICCLRTLFSFNNIKLTLRRYFLGLFFFMAVWCANASSLVSFLLMRPYPFLFFSFFFFF